MRNRFEEAARIAGEQPFRFVVPFVKAVDRYQVCDAILVVVSNQKV